LFDFATIRHAGRFRDIIGVLFKYGFDGIIERLDIPGHLLVKKITHIEEGVSIWGRIRMALEELGPTFVKFGQIMSMRPDLIPKGLVVELRRLQETVVHEPFPVVKTAVETSLGKPLEDIFDDFDHEPIAAASLAQVHRARLKDTGDNVAVKVQRPNINDIIKSDLYILDVIAGLIHDRLEAMRLYNLPGLVAEVKKHVTKELDFIHEASNIEIFRHNFKGVEDVYVPVIYPELTTKTVLTMELIDGVHADEVDRIGADREVLAKRGVEIALKMILVDGFFHADPHLGNLRFLPGNIICFLDWGMVGRLTREMRYAILDFITAIVEKDAQKLVQTTLSMAMSVPPLLDETGLQNEVMDIIDTLHAQALLSVNVGRLFLDLIGILRQHNVELRSDYVFMLKSLMAIEGVGQHLYPKFDVIEQARPFIKRLALERFNPVTALQYFISNISKLSKLLGSLPERSEKILKTIEGERLSIRIQHQGLERMNSSIYLAGNRITFGLVIAALIIGSSMIITSGVGPFLFGYPVLGILGFLFSVVLGLWLIIQMIRGRKL
jgi:ubiquinone biosynthesis protein